MCELNFKKWVKSTVQHWKDWSWTSTTLATGKDPDAGKDWRQEEKGMVEDKMFGWYHWLKGHEFEQTLGDGDGLGSLACCSPWGRKESYMTEWLNNKKSISSSPNSGSREKNKPPLHLIIRFSRVNTGPNIFKSLQYLILCECVCVSVSVCVCVCVSHELHWIIWHRGSQPGVIFHP